MFWKRLAALAVFASLVAPVAASAQTQRKAKSKGVASPSAQKMRGGAGALPPIEFTEFTLPNGLNVIMHPDRSTPIVAVNVYYNVGSRDEKLGRTGFAHLFEHMLFQGSKNWPDVYNKPLEEAGGTINGTTNEDRTMYYEVVPSNFLELALYLEADRMGNLLDAMTMEKLDNQREVVKNEKRQRIDNQPYGLAWEKIAKTMYPAGHPYSWLVIGSMEDLSAAALEDVKDFFRTYYVPNNATLVLAGDFDVAETRRMVEKHFGAIKSGEPVARVNTALQTLDRERREQVEDSVKLERVYLTWQGVPMLSKDDAALDALADVLASGKGSRLYKTLVYDQQIAQDVSASHDSRQIAGEFQIIATAKPGKTLAEVEAALNAELVKLKAAPPTSAEMERAYNEREASFVYGLQTVLGKSTQLNHYNYYVNRPAYFNEDLARYRAVRPADVQRAARQYLNDKRYVLSVVPQGTLKKTGEPAAAGPKAESPAPASQQASGTAAGAASAAATGDRPAGAQPQTKVEAAQTMAQRATPPTGGAQTGAPAKQKGSMGDVSKLPKPSADPQLKLPAIQRRTLSNGLEVLVVEHKELPVVNMNLIVKTGSAADAQDRAGLASITAALLDEGTKTRTALDISNQLAAIGSTLSTGSGWDSSGVTMLTLTRHLDRALDIFADVVVNPSFPADEFDRQSKSRLASLQSRKANGNAVAGDVFPTLLYGRTHPYGHPALGDETSVKAMTTDDVRRFYETFFRPNNSALVVVGDVQPDALVVKLEKAFAKWEKAPVPVVDVTAAPVQRERATVYVVDRPNSPQSVLMVGHVGVPRSTPDYFSLLILNRILGGSFSSRINMNLRETKGYTYGAGSSFDYRRGSGPFSAGADVRTNVTKESIEEVLKELNDIRGGRPVSQAELDFAKQAVIRAYPRGFETPSQIANQLATVVLYDLPDDYFNNYIANVNAITAEKLTEAAQRHLNPSRVAILVVGDRKAIEQSLRSLDEVGSTVTFVDTEGRTVTASTSGGAGTGNPQQ